jgi:hypothetical protein
MACESGIYNSNDILNNSNQMVNDTNNKQNNCPSCLSILYDANNSLCYICHRFLHGKNECKFGKDIRSLKDEISNNESNNNLICYECFKIIKNKSPFLSEHTNKYRKNI